MLTKSAAILIAGLLAQSATASIVCTGPTALGSVLKVTLQPRSAVVEVKETDGVLSLTQQYAHTTDTWDGHMTGLITAPGLAVRYENQYGCIRNVTITTNVRGGGIGLIEELHMTGCLGGTTPDSLCFPNN